MYVCVFKAGSKVICPQSFTAFCETGYAFAPGGCVRACVCVCAHAHVCALEVFVQHFTLWKVVFLSSAAEKLELGCILSVSVSIRAAAPTCSRGMCLVLR